MADNLFTEIDNILSEDLALPRIEDLIPSPGDVLHSFLGDKSLDRLGKKLGDSLKSGLGSAPKLPGM